MADNLPLEIITNILSRIPVKDLLRYRSVSKPWCSLIDGPYFINLHLNHSNQTNSNLAAVLFNETDILWADLDPLVAAVKINRPTDDAAGKMEVLGSCNGLLALLNSRDDVVLWNPSTRRYKKLPTTDDVDFPEGFFYHGFHFYGFGQDPINDDYKLVRVTQFHGELEHSFDSVVDVYSSKFDSWTRKKGFLPYRLRVNIPNGVLVGNALHWMASRWSKSDDSKFIVAFDLVTEKYREIPMPKFQKNGTIEVYLEVLGSSLCVTCNYFMRHYFLGLYEDFVLSNGVEIWVMKEYGVKRRWTKLFTVEPSEANGGFGYVTPVAYSKSGDQVVLHLDNNRFVLYDLIKKRDEKARINGLPKHFGVYSCVGSLVGLNGGWGDGEENRKKNKKGKDKEQRNKKKESNSKQRDDFLSKGFKLML